MKSQFILFFIIISFCVSAQNSIEGGISNKNGGAIIAAVVTMHNEFNVMLTQKMATDDMGYFIMKDIPNGAYFLEITTANYESIKIENFQFPRDRDKVVGLTMIRKKNYYQPIQQNFIEKIAATTN